MLFYSICYNIMTLIHSCEHGCVAEFQLVFQYLLAVSYQYVTLTFNIEV